MLPPCSSQFINFMKVSSGAGHLIFLWMKTSAPPHDISRRSSCTHSKPVSVSTSMCVKVMKKLPIFMFLAIADISCINLTGK